MLSRDVLLLVTLAHPAGRVARDGVDKAGHTQPRNVRRRDHIGSGSAGGSWQRAVAAMRPSPERDGQVVEERPQVLVPHLAGVLDEAAAVGDELVGDLAQERGHALGGVVVPRDGVHHLDVVHQRRHGVNHVVRRPAVHGLQALLQRDEVLDVVLGLVRHVRDAHVHGLPLLVDLGPGRHEHAQHDARLPLLQLLHHRVELGHARAPVLELRVRAVVLAARARLVRQEALNAVTPDLEHALQVRHQLRVVRGLGERVRLQLHVRGLRAGAGAGARRRAACANAVERIRRSARAPARRAWAAPGPSGWT